MQQTLSTQPDYFQDNFRLVHKKLWAIPDYDSRENTIFEQFTTLDNEYSTNHVVNGQDKILDTYLSNFFMLEKMDQKLLLKHRKTLRSILSNYHWKPLKRECSHIGIGNAKLNSLQPYFSTKIVRR